MMTLRVRGRMEDDDESIFVRCFFVGSAVLFFHQLRVGAMNTTFPFSILPSHTQKAAPCTRNFLSYTQRLENWAQLTRKFPSPSHPRAPHNLVKQRKKKKSFCAKARRLFTCFISPSLCAMSEGILMTLTLNENEVTINYIKYDVSYNFRPLQCNAPQHHQVYLNVISHRMHHQHNLPMPLNRMMVLWPLIEPTRYAQEKCKKVP